MLSMTANHSWRVRHGTKLYERDIMTFATSGGQLRIDVPGGIR